MAVADLRDLEPRTLAPGVTARLLHGDAVTVMRASFVPGASVPTHRHPHEQVTTVLAGRLRLTIAGVEHLMEPGMSAVIPGNVEHSASADAECHVLDVFTPVREDLR